jgi:23S rRNA (pseudouridine1915-N3)-methyltransferase
LLDLRVIVVGRPGALLRDAIMDYERRAGRYWNFEAIEVREERLSRAGDEARVRDVEGARLLERVPAGAELIAMTRTGERWHSTRLARHLQDAADTGRAAVAFVIGGAYGLSPDVLARANRELSLSAFTFPHDMARLALAEQLYRAGTILRNEPYHKASE